VRERMIEANGVELCTEPFGDPCDPPVLLVMASVGRCSGGRRVSAGCLPRAAGSWSATTTATPAARSPPLRAVRSTAVPIWWSMPSASSTGTSSWPRTWSASRGGWGVRAAARARLSRSRPVARPHQHVSGDSRGAQPSLADGAL